MLVVFVLLYLLLTIGVGLWAARRVRNSRDYLVAGRSLPLYVVAATVFATWFGAETVLSVSAVFARDGLGGIVGDPFGASFCLVLVALFFARAFYRMDLLTIGDFYRKRYNRQVEVMTGIAITVSYLGWISAQFTALGLVFAAISGGAVGIDAGIVLGAAIVLGYTLWGGMWSVAYTDVFQSVVIIAGLWLIAWFVGDRAGGAAGVVAAAHDAGKFDFWPKGGTKEWLAFLAAWMTMAVGTIPQQDVFQRVTSAKNEKTAIAGALLGGFAYFCFAFVPVYIAYAALVTDPGLAKSFASEDAREVQRILPDLVLGSMPLWAQVVFFGALLSAILSTASGALLAPSAVAAENVLRPFMPRMGDARFLLLLRCVLAAFTLGALAFALQSRSSMYEMVQNAYKVTLVSCVVPLAFGIYWKRASTAGAVASVVLGLAAWIGLEVFTAGIVLPPVLAGLLASAFGMVAGSLVWAIDTRLE